MYCIRHKLRTEADFIWFANEGSPRVARNNGEGAARFIGFAFNSIDPKG
jgi:hypothetical protein